MLYLALYKGKGDWKDKAIRLFTRGQYSHCELAILNENTHDFDCYTSSPRDGGVRMKRMSLPPEDWDLIVLPERFKLNTLKLFDETCGAKYDLIGALGVVILMRERATKWFCSEWCGTALGLPESWRFSPNDLAQLAKGLTQ
jgi:putative cytoplasmic protein